MQLHLQQIDVAAYRIERRAQLVAHYRQKFRFRAVRGVRGRPRFLGFADRRAQLLIRQRELVSELASLVLLVLELAGLALQQGIALLERGDARSSRVTQSGHSDCANHCIYFGEREWHVPAAKRVTILTISYS